MEFQMLRYFLAFLHYYYCAIHVAIIIVRCFNCGCVRSQLRNLLRSVNRMMSRLSQSIQRYCLLTTSPIVRTASLRHSNTQLLSTSTSTIRTFTLSHKSNFQHSYSPPQSKISKSFPEAMEAIKQTVAQNIGISVCTTPAPQPAVDL